MYSHSRRDTRSACDCYDDHYDDELDDVHHDHDNDEDRDDEHEGDIGYIMIIIMN